MRSIPSPQRLAVFLPNWVGDVAMATPALRTLREQLPDARLVGVMRPYAKAVLDGSSWLDSMLLYEKKATDPQLSRSTLPQRIKNENCDSCLLLTNSFSTAWLATRARIAQRIGYARHGRRWLLTHSLQAPRSRDMLLPRSAVDGYLDLVRYLGLAPVSHQLELHVTEQERAFADHVWATLSLSDAPTFILNTGGAYGAAKTWPVEPSAQLGRQLASELGVNVLVSCGPAERSAAEQIVQQARHPRVHSLAGFESSLGLLKGCVQRSAMVISTDSGPRHIAAALQIPTVAVFGPTDPRWSVNYNHQEVVVNRQESCAPCGQRTCPLQHHRCMRDLTASTVFAAAASLWDSSRTMRSRPEAA